MILVNPTMTGISIRRTHAQFFFSLIRTATRAVNVAKFNDVWPDGKDIGALNIGDAPTVYVVA